MSRINSLYKDSFNRSLGYIRELGAGASLPTESSMAKKWGISRTTVRSVLQNLDELKIVSWQGRDKIVLRKPRKSDYYPVAETETASRKVENLFMEYVLGGDLAPGTILHETELVREFDVSTSAVREYLIRFSRFGLIEKQPNRHWILKGFTHAFAMELFDIREIFEVRALNAYLKSMPSEKANMELTALKQAHLALLDDFDARYLEFPTLDERFHRTFIDKLDNRFVDDFYELVSLIFHFHYRWKKTDERDRNEVAAREHLSVIRAILTNKPTSAQKALDRHLKSARHTLLMSVAWN